MEAHNVKARVEGERQRQVKFCVANPSLEPASQRKTEKCCQKETFEKRKNVQLNQNQLQ